VGLISSADARAYEMLA